MTHYSRLCMIVIDVPDPDHDRELAFWGAATGQSLARLAFCVVPDPPGRLNDSNAQSWD
ncbi:MAG TPA: hypothetical protein VF979_09075 [Streptosporangiaceae bacterium]